MSLDKSRRAPYEGITGLSCRIAPHTETLVLGDPDNDVHHGIFTPKEQGGKKFFTSRGDLGRFVLHSNIQIVARAEHNMGPNAFHPKYLWAKLSRGELGQVRLGLMGLAGAASRKVVDMRSGETRAIRDDEREHLFHSGEVTVDPLAHFYARRVLTGFTVRHGMPELGPEEVAKYRDMRHEDDRRAFVDETLGLWLPSSFAPFNDRFREATAARLLPPQVPHTPSILAAPYVLRNPERASVFTQAFINTWGPVAKAA